MCVFLKEGNVVRILEVTVGKGVIGVSLQEFYSFRKGLGWLIFNCLDRFVARAENEINDVVETVTSDRKAGVCHGDELVEILLWNSLVFEHSIVEGHGDVKGLDCHTIEVQGLVHRGVGH